MALKPNYQVSGGYQQPKPPSGYGFTPEEYGNASVDPNYGLGMAKKYYAEAQKRGDKAGTDYFAQQGQYYRSAGATLDPNNTMNAEQYWSAYTSPKQTGYEQSAPPAYSQPADYFSQQQGYINNYMGQMNNYMSQYSAAGLQMLKDYQANYAQALDQLKGLMQQKPDVPESVKTAIDIMKQQTAENAKAIDEQLNAMGVLYSGRTGQEHDKLYQNMDNQTRTLLSNWLDQQHQQMYQAALKLADMQAGYARDYANLSAQYQLGAIDKAMGLAGQQYQMQSGLAKDQQNYDLQLRQMAAQQQAAANKQYWDNYWNQMKYTTPTAGEQLTHDAALQRIRAINARSAAAKTGKATTPDTYLKAVEMARGDVKLSDFKDTAGNVNLTGYQDAFNSRVRMYDALLRRTGENPDTSNALGEDTYTYVEDLINAARSNGASNQQIADILRRNGYNPGDWNLP